MSHLSVLYHEIIHALSPHSAGLYVDGTLGAGGHAWGILDASSPNGKLLGLDLDPQALGLAQARLSSFQGRAILRKASYTEMEQQLDTLGWSAVDGIVLDLGVSSMQFDTPERGFSYRTEAPLDMRFDPNGSITAAHLVNDLPEKELADLIYRYGEERRSRQIARTIIAERPITSTLQLANLISRVNRGHASKLHPATRTFQALRIAVNAELDSIEMVLPMAVGVLKSGGRLAVISFHSLEDRIVKQYFRQESQDCLCPPKQPICTCGHKAVLKEISRRPVRPADSEVDANPRARSARLRIVEKR